MRLNQPDVADSANQKKEKEIRLEQIREQFPDVKIKLGIALAGAVSAGAYSAGAMYYILDTLETWERLKNINYNALANLLDAAIGEKTSPTTEQISIAMLMLQEKNLWVDIPMHDVTLEVMAGSSAGSLVASITVLSLGYKQEGLIFDEMINNHPGDFAPVQEIESRMDSKAMSRNLLYDSWVNMNDGGNQNEVFEKLLIINDDERKSKTFSLLNGTVMDRIRDYQITRLFDCATKVYTPKPIPAFVSPKLKVMFSLTFLRGIQYSVAFNHESKTFQTDHPSHRMKWHSFMARFASKPDLKKEFELDVHKRESAENLINASLASGAFPIGLPPRIVQFSPSQIAAYFESINIEPGGKVQVHISDTLPPDHVVVDGGVLNNEPIMEVFRHLIPQENGKALEVAKATTDEVESTEFNAMILIDPFPNFESATDGESKMPGDFIAAASGLLSTMRGQGMMKDIRPLAAGKHSENLILGMISPSRKDERGCPTTPALATAAFEGFAGFLSREFRFHDFYLGMRNAQGFCQEHFSFPPQNQKDKNSNISHVQPIRVLPDIVALQKKEKTLEGRIVMASLFSPEELKRIEGRKESKELSLEYESPKFLQGTQIVNQGEIAEEGIRFGSIYFPGIEIHKLESLRGLMAKRISFLIYHRFRLAVSFKPKEKNVSPRLRNTMMFWLIVPALFLMGLLVGLWWVLGAQFFWLLILSFLLLTVLIRHAILQWLANWCIYAIIGVLTKNKQIKP